MIHCRKTWPIKEIGIILLTEKFGKEFPDILEDVRLNHKLPLLIEIPGPSRYRKSAGLYHFLCK